MLVTLLPIVTLASLMQSRNALASMLATAVAESTRPSGCRRRRMPGSRSSVTLSGITDLKSRIPRRQADNSSTVIFE
jgi:hypothetical protein